MAVELDIPGLTTIPDLADNDLLIIQDVSTGKTNKITVGQFLDMNDCGDLCVTVPLSSAQILALNSSPVLAVPPPGAGKIIIVTDCVIDYAFGTTPYVFSFGDQTGAFIDTATAQSASFSNFLTHGSSWIKLGTSSQAGDLFANKGLYIKNALADPTGGDGTAKIYLTYKIKTL